MKTLTELVSTLLFTAGAGLQVMTPTALSVPGVTMAALAILGALTLRPWSWR